MIFLYVSVKADLGHSNIEKDFWMTFGRPQQRLSSRVEDSSLDSEDDQR